MRKKAWFNQPRKKNPKFIQKASTRRNKAHKYIYYSHTRPFVYVVIIMYTWHEPPAHTWLTYLIRENKSDFFAVMPLRFPICAEGHIHTETGSFHICRVLVFASSLGGPSCQFKLFDVCNLIIRAGISLAFDGIVFNVVWLQSSYGYESSAYERRLKVELSFQTWGSLLAFGGLDSIG